MRKIPDLLPNPEAKLVRAILHIVHDERITQHTSRVAAIKAVLAAYEEGEL